ncbi:unnamed protein product, partial [Discosporangium mesarthrocarpum]
GGSGGGPDLSSSGLIEGAVPVLFAGRSWGAYLHHVHFIVALMHVGTSLMPKNLIKILGHYLGYTPSFEQGLALLSGCCREKGMRRPCAAAILELLVFREKGFRRHIQFRTEADGDGGKPGMEGAEGARRAKALDNAQGSLESFYGSFPVVPLLSVAHAKALQASGDYQGAHELCTMAQAVVDQSVEKGKGMGPAHHPHVLWLQMAHSSFFLQKWEDALQFFTRIVVGVKQTCDKDERGLTGLGSAYAAASMCGVQPIDGGAVHKLLVSACTHMKDLEALGNVKEHPVLKGRLREHAARGPPGAELWLYEVLYLHNASAANGMPEAWHQ